MTEVLTIEERMTLDPANAGREQDGRFSAGCSGNLAGMKPGTRHRATRLAEKLMSGDTEDVVKAVISAAKDGDMTNAPAAAGRGDAVEH